LPTVQRKTITGHVSWPRFEGLSFETCRFDNCFLAAPEEPSHRSLIRSVQLRDITQHACWIEGAAIEDVSLDRLKAGGDMPLYLNGCVFKHVTLSGQISGIKINRNLVGRTDESVRAVWDVANEQYYGTTDWALDISRVRFTSSPTFEAIPGSLIRRDPETQVLLLRSALAVAHWETAVDFGTTSLDIAISWFLTGSLFDDCVLAAARANRKFMEEMAVLEALRRRGLAR